MYRVSFFAVLLVVMSGCASMGKLDPANYQGVGAAASKTSLEAQRSSGSLAKHYASWLKQGDLDSAAQKLGPAPVLTPGWEKDSLPVTMGREYFTEAYGWLGRAVMLNRTILTGASIALAVEAEQAGSESLFLPEHEALLKQALKASEDASKSLARAGSESSIERRAAKLAAAADCVAAAFEATEQVIRLDLEPLQALQASEAVRALTKTCGTVHDSAYTLAQALGSQDSERADWEGDAFSGLETAGRAVRAVSSFVPY